MTNSASPVLQNERIDILDVLRGFAILGILLDNLFGFTGWGYFTMEQRTALATWPADGILGVSELAFINGKFYTLFSFLFGIGFSIILVRNEQRGVNPLKIFYRRLFILLLIGAGHLFLLWEGDILFLYALIGFVLPLFRNCSDTTLLTWAVILIASPILVDSINVVFQTNPGAYLEEVGKKIDQRNGIPLADAGYSQYLYGPGSGWQEWRNWQASGWAYRFSYLLESNRIPKVLGIFLIGYYAGRNMLYARLEEQTTLLKKIRKWGFITGIPLSIAMAIFEIDDFSIPKPMGLSDTVLYAASVVPLSFAITSSICLHWIKTKGQSWLKWLAPAGRMALTNYLMQTILSITLFYGIGFGLGGKIGPSLFFPIGIGIYLFQVLYSNLWFRYFNYGPMEWIWRQLTYGKRLPIRKQ
ncbi:MAG TPA: DUF418 domain-containing protein [Ferruginibacter sp.]|nr:DUF418 domain-containing protein [Ferruginibacter sp.]